MFRLANQEDLKDYWFISFSARHERHLFVSLSPIVPHNQQGGRFVLVHDASDSWVGKGLDGLACFLVRDKIVPAKSKTDGTIWIQTGEPTHFPGQP